MNDDLDDRIAYLRQQNQLEGAAQSQRAADLVLAIDELQSLVRGTAFKSATVEAKMKLVEKQMDELERRMKRMGPYLIGATAICVTFGILVISVALWSVN